MARIAVIFTEELELIKNFIACYDSDRMSDRHCCTQRMDQLA